MILGYVGPETALPVFSLLASVLGVLLIAWRFLMDGVKHFAKSVWRRWS